MDIRGIKTGGCLMRHNLDQMIFTAIIWPASRKKGHSDITNSVDSDQPLQDIENSYM